MNELELLDELKSYKHMITTVREWDEFSKERGLPSSSVLISKYGTWNKLKKALKIPYKESSTYTLDSLKKIAKDHKEHFVSIKTWNEYAKENNLPAATTFILHFDKWSKVKEFLDINEVVTKKAVYTKDSIKEILEKHGEYLKSRTQWDEYAKEKQLPTYLTLKKFYTWEEILKLSNKEKRFNLTTNDLLKIASKHYTVFVTSSKRKWEDYSKENNLPSYQTFIRMFGTWKKAKSAVIQYREKIKGQSF